MFFLNISRVDIFDEVAKVAFETFNAFVEPHDVIRLDDEGVFKFEERVAQFALCGLFF